METYFADQPLNITVPLVTPSNLAVIDATDVKYTVVDGDGFELTEVIPVTVDAGAGLVEIELDASLSELADGEVRAYRQLNVTFTTGGKTYTVFEEFLVELANALMPLSNSFQTYASAMTLSAEITGLDSLNESTRRERMAAFINAYNTLSRLRYVVSLVDSDSIVNIPSTTLDQFNALPKNFVSALKHAQVIEANEALDNFSILKKRQQGLMSETIGESSMMFRPEKVLNIPVTRRSMDLLRPYLVWDLSVGRG